VVPVFRSSGNCSCRCMAFARPRRLPQAARFPNRLHAHPQAPTEGPQAQGSPGSCWRWLTAPRGFDTAPSVRLDEPLLEDRMNAANAIQDRIVLDVIRGVKAPGIGSVATFQSS
jgi:hypothetical protein